MHSDILQCMKKILLGLFFIILATSLFFLVLVSIASKQALALYYILWICGVGVCIWKKRDYIEQNLVSWNVSTYTKFILLGLGMILLEETIAGISMHLIIANDLTDIMRGVLQFWAFNLLALPGFIIAWSFLLSKIAYTRQEVFILVGLFGVFSEKTSFKIMAFPVAGLALVLPTMLTYMIIIAPSVMSFRGTTALPRPRWFKYTLGIVAPLVVSIPFVLVLTYLITHYSRMFPPVGFIS